jgi:hypothetical protein
MKFKSIFPFLLFAVTTSIVIPAPIIPSSNSNILQSMTSSVTNAFLDLPAEARGRKGSYRVGGTGRSGKGSTYFGGR